MEYLPTNPNENDLKTVEKTERKLKDFREYIVDKGVVLALVKVLLSLKYADDKPKNPIKAIREFFGKYHDTKWDEMEVLKEEIILLSGENPKLFEKIQQLEEELNDIKKAKRMKNLFRSYECDKNGQISTKLIVEKLTGNKKFEVDEKLGHPEFVRLIEMVTDGEIDCYVFINKLEESVQGTTPFKEDLDNFLYKKMVQIIKDMKKPQLNMKK